MKILRTKYSTAGGVALVAVALLATLPFLMGQGGETPAPAKPLKIEGVSLSEAEANGFLLTEPEGEAASLSADAVSEISAKEAGAPTQVVLAHLKDTNVEPDIDRLVWVTILDPANYPHGGESDYTNLVMAFFDASTGEWLFTYGQESSCTDTAETMAECEKRGIKPRPVESIQPVP